MSSFTRSQPSQTPGKEKESQEASPELVSDPTGQEDSEASQSVRLGTDQSDDPEGFQRDHPLLYALKYEDDDEAVQNQLSAQ